MPKQGTAQPHTASQSITVRVYPEETARIQSYLDAGWSLSEVIRLAIHQLPPPPIDDPRARMAADPIDRHHPNCQCTRCTLGDDAALWLLHPDEY